MAKCKHFGICNIQEDNLEDGYCILHSENLNKDLLDFHNALKDHLEKEITDFSHFIFITPLVLNKIKSSKNFKFDSATFYDPLFFENSEFHGELKFSNCTFLRGVIIKDCKFFEDISFSEIKFSKIYHILDSHFLKNLDFKNCTFEKDAYYHNCIFNGLTIEKTSFAISLKISDSTFEDNIDISEIEVKETLSITESHMKKKFSILNQILEKSLKHLLFRKSVFYDIVEFTNIKVNHFQIVDKTIFMESASFNNLEIDHGFLGKSEFKNILKIFKTTFSEAIEFYALTLENEFSFNSCRFKGTTLFLELKGNCSKYDFSRSYFSGKTLFAGSEENKLFFGKSVLFLSTTLNPSNVVSFRNVDLSKCQFLDTDLRGIEFTDVIWPKLNNRSVVFDEFDLQKNKLNKNYNYPWEKIERLYRELKHNYEDRKDYARSGDFNFAEKEIRLNNPKTSKSEKFLIFLYKLFSGYGEEVLKPFFWLISIFIFSTFFYLVFGMSYIDSAKKVHTIDLDNLVQNFNLKNLMGVCLYSLRTMFFLLPPNLEIIGDSYFVNTIERLLSPLFLTLFALAIRQKLKR